ncbi:hypothetical protein VSS74_10695 [Conexibacter stalactiti]|uniref:Uncharacterized protein n=1 Tax=Conexibacter stalactiti TaxID=1940611 RepID=A0ABU4HND2_9ACTN|nr:hypothetical protein [Conexibacter stalactiti]MDW5594808.1 hypothetical protein [Conexibacter stalactiti]MEC5035450.1 hypothetical protein [Conexibacter stalactiti]
MSDLDFLDGLERDLVAAAARRRDARRAALLARLRQRLGLRHTGLAALLVVLVGAATAGATFAVLRASVISGPAARDTPRDQLPLPASARVSELRTPDPDPAAPPWTLRLARSSTGLLCTTTGQVDDGRFGLVGLDGRFRVYSERIVDSCGERVAGARASLVGARIFDADRHADVRTVVNGVGGSQLRGATLVLADGRRAVPLGAGGTFVTALRGYPEDTALRVELRFAGGAVERHDFGTDPAVVPDPEGGRAWRVDVSLASESSDRDRCVEFRPARSSRTLDLFHAEPPTSPALCGRTRRGMPPTGVYFGARRIEPGSGGRSAWRRGHGWWGDHPARTALWGGFANDVARIEVLGPGGERRVPALGRRHLFLALFPATVDPRALRVRVTLRDGSVREHRGDTGLTAGRWRG